MYNFVVHSNYIPCRKMWRLGMDPVLEVFCEIHHFLIRVLLVGFHLLLVGLNCGLYDDELFIRLVIHIVAYFWHLEAWGMKISISEIEQLLQFGAIWRRWELMSKQPGQISVFSTWFVLSKFGRLGSRV